MLNYIFLFITGIIFGSFLNAYSLRASKKIPKLFNFIENKNLNYYKNILAEFRLFKYSNLPERSYCPICKNQLKWFHNIPLFSYIFLKGKCSFCNTKIPFIYFLSELFLGFIFCYIFYLNKEILNIDLFLFLFIISIFYSSMIIDLKTTYIPDYTFVLTLIPLLILSNNINNNYILNFELSSLFSYLILPIIFYYSIYLLNFITYKFLNKIYIGFADIKLLSFIMILYGFQNTIIIYFISAYISILPILIQKMKKNKNKEIPYGIYIFISFIFFELYKSYIFKLLNL